MGLGPGGQPINANRLSGGGGIGPMGTGGQSKSVFTNAGKATVVHVFIARSFIILLLILCKSKLI